MRLWTLVLCVAATLLVHGPVAARSQSFAGPVLIGVLVSSSETDAPRYLGSFRRGLEELGYVEGRDYVLDLRFAEGAAARLPILARELVLRKPRIIVAGSVPAVLAAREATTELPIVSPFLGSGVASGVIASQARPGGNVTGVLGSVDAGLVGKQVSLARETIPNIAKMGILLNSRTSVSGDLRRSAEAAAAELSLELTIADAQSPVELDGAFASLAAAGAQAVWVSADPMFFKERESIARAAQAAAMPTVFAFREHVEAGGLASYGIDLVESYRRTAAYVDKILNGAKPAELPAEVPTRFELVINLKTARALGLSIPESFLVRADEVIE